MKTKIYTKGGDAGETSIIGGTRVSKADIRLDAYGTVDELNASLGVAIASLAPSMEARLDLRRIEELLKNAQNDLFAVGSQLACADAEMLLKMPKIRATSVGDLEMHIDQMTAELPELREFILPGGSMTAATMHWARTVCRRTERAVVHFDTAEGGKKNAEIIRYLNRLGDYLFVAARYVSYKTGTAEIRWQKS